MLLVAVVLWVAWPFVGTILPVVLPLGGLIAFVGAWLFAGASLSPARPGRGAAFGALAYLGCGVLWVLAWNSALRFHEDILLPELRDPDRVLVTVATWPWQAFGWGILDQFN